MNKSRKLSLINMCVNFTIIVLEIVGLYLTLNMPLSPDIPVGPDLLKYYTVLTAIVTFVAAGLMIWANIISFAKKRDCTPRLFYSLRFLSAVMSLLTFVTVVAVLRPFYLTAPKVQADVLFDIKGGSLFIHFLCPVISMLQFIGLEIEPKAKFKKTLEPFIATIVYAIGLLTAVLVIGATQGATAAATFSPYFFCWITPEIAEAAAHIPNGFPTNYLSNIGIAIGVTCLSYVGSVILWCLNRISHNLFIGEEYVPAGAKKKVVKTTKKTTAAPVKKSNAITSYVKKKVAFGDDTAPTSGQIYHISYHDRRLKTWKVKSENAGRALKVFPSQKEAIAFANEQIKKNGGSIRVHSVVGQIRKE